MQLSLRFWQSLVMGQRIVSYTVSTGTYKRGHNKFQTIEPTIQPSWEKVSEIFHLDKENSSEIEILDCVSTNLSILNCFALFFSWSFMSYPYIQTHSSLQYEHILQQTQIVLWTLINRVIIYCTLSWIFLGLYLTHWSCENKLYLTEKLLSLKK